MKKAKSVLNINQKPGSLFRLLKIVFLSVFLLFLAATSLLLYFEYEAFVDALIGFYGIEAQREAFLDMFSPRQYHWLRLFMGAMVLFWLLMTIFVSRVIQWLKRQWRFVRQESKLKIRSLKLRMVNMPRWELNFLIAFMVCLFVFRSYALFTVPFINDELFSYLFLVNKGLPVTSTFFQGPNSHILYLQLCVLTDTFLSPEMAMKLPTFLIGLILPFFMFLYLRSHVNFSLSYFSTLIFSLAFNVHFYSVVGRGHILMLFFFAVAVYAAFNLVEDKQLIYYILFMGASIGGFYTMLTFFYPFLGLMIFMVGYAIYEKDKRQLIKLGYTLICIVAVVSFLYLPVVIMNGVEAFTDNWWVRSMRISADGLWETYSKYLEDMLGYFWQSDNYGLWFTVVLVGSGLVVMWQKHRRWFWLVNSCMWIPVIAMPVQLLIPPHRTWLFMFFLMSICVGMLIGNFTIKLPKRYKLPVLGLISFAILSISVWQWKREPFDYYRQLGTFMQQVRELRPKQVLVPEDTYYLFLRYEFETRQALQVKIDTVKEPDKDYDLLVLTKEQEWPEGFNADAYQVIADNDRVIAFFRR